MCRFLLLARTAQHREGWLTPLSSARLDVSAAHQYLLAAVGIALKPAENLTEI